MARILQERGAELIDADVLSRKAVRPGSPALERIARRWGSSVLNPDGTLDRAALRSRVFSDHDELEELNRIVHPEVKRLRDQELAEARERGERIVVSDIPLLFERGLANEFDYVILRGRAAADKARAAGSGPRTARDGSHADDRCPDAC